MKHVRLTLTPVGRADEVPAMFRLLSSAPYLDRVVGLHWNVSGDRLGLLLYAEGDVDVFRDEIQHRPEVLDFELVSVDDDRFYVYLQNELNDVSQQLFGTFTRAVCSSFRPSSTAVMALRRSPCLDRSTRYKPPLRRFPYRSK